MLYKLAWQSLLHRRTTVLLTILSIAISVMTVLGIEHIRQETKKSFTSTLSGTDLIIGARGSRLNLLLYSVFRIGSPTSNISWESYEKIKSQKGVSWTIPISLGDSHKGYRVLGTSEDYFTHYRYSNKRTLTFSSGKPFHGVYDVVLGSEVAKQLNYQLGEKIVISHGISEVSFTLHDDKPFTVTGILKPTGTPVDQTLHISLAGMEAIHIDWQNGSPISGLKISAEDALKHDLTPKAITAFLLGLDNRIMTFRLQRAINNYRTEPLMAILPGVVLSELWHSMSIIERVLALIASLVVIAALLGMITMVLATLKQRQRELSILRSIGAPTRFIFMLIQMEVLFITLLGIIVGIGLLSMGLVFAQPAIADYYGVVINPLPLSGELLTYCAVIITLALVLACVPAYSAYRQSLAKNLSHEG